MKIDFLIGRSVNVKLRNNHMPTGYADTLMGILEKTDNPEIYGVRAGVSYSEPQDPKNRSLLETIIMYFDPNDILWISEWKFRDAPKE